MSEFFYTAISADGQRRNGSMQARDHRELAQNLKKEGLVLISIAEHGKKRGLKTDIPIPFINRVSLTEKLMMVRNLGVMFATGLSLVKSLEVLSGQTRSQKLKAALADIRDKINQGSNLSDAMNAYPTIFGDLFVSMIKVGEESGTLDEVFQNLSLQFEKEHEIKAKIRGAMIYPAIIILVMIVVGIIMVTFVFPNLKVFFQNLNANIPLTTRILLGTGDFLGANWYLIPLVPFALAAALFATMRTKGGKKFIDGLLLRIPVIRGVVKKNNSALLIRSLSSLMSSGVPLTRSLEISAKTISNHYYREATAAASEKIKKGEKLSDTLRPYQKIFPYGVIEMMEVGEETGKTSAVLKKLAEFYEEEAIKSIEKITVLIEPVLIIFLGLGVGVFAFSIIQPMYSSLSSITTQ